MGTALITIGMFVALIVGFFAGRWHGMSQRSKQLSEELEQKEEELKDLKSNVNEHFSETARLFTNLTEEYKSLYQHLAKGANKLSDENFKLALGTASAEVLTDKSSAFNQEDITDVNDDDMVSEPVIQPVDYARPDVEATEDEVEEEKSADEQAGIETQSQHESTEEAEDEPAELEAAKPVSD